MVLLSMGDWDDDEWEAPDLNAPTAKAPPTSWSDDEEEDDEPKKPTVAPSANTPKPPAPKTGLALKIAEREKREAEEARKKAEIRQKLMAGDEEAFAGLEGEDLKRARKQKELEAAALDSAIDAFGVIEPTAAADGGESSSALDTLKPVSTKDFETLATLLNQKLAPHEGKPGHIVALKGLIRAAAASLSTDDAKDLSSFVGVIYNDKVKADRDKDKTKKKKGPKAKASLSGAKGGGFDDYDGDRGDVDDFF